MTPDVFAQQEQSLLTDSVDVQERSKVSASNCEEDSEKMGTLLDNDDAETVVLRRLTVDNKNVEHVTSVEGDNCSASVSEVCNNECHSSKCTETSSLLSSTCVSDVDKAGSSLETSNMSTVLDAECRVTSQHNNKSEYTDQFHIATATDSDTLSSSVSHHDDEHERAVAADIERLYSFVRKKTDRTRHSLRVETSNKVATADTETMKLKFAESENMSEMVNSNDNIQMSSLCNNVEQTSSGICCEPLPPAVDVEVLLTTLNRSSSDVEVPLAGANDAAYSSSQSCCEDIGQQTLQHHRESDIVEYRTLTSGTLLLAHRDLSLTMCDTKPLSNSEQESFTGTLLAYDGQGYAYYVPAVDLKVYGDAAGELWFFPVPLTPLQATILLSTKQIAGSFLLYCEFPHYDSTETLRLSVYSGADVLHYSIVRNRDGDLSLAGDDRSFLTLSDLIRYFQHNKSCLATRLGRALSVSHLPVTAGLDYDAKYELVRSQLRLTGNIIGNGRFGVICAGKYRGHPVAVKVFSTCCGYSV